MDRNQLFFVFLTHLVKEETDDNVSIVLNMICRVFLNEIVCGKCVSHVSSYFLSLIIFLRL